MIKTTEDLIKFLPLNEELKKKLIEAYPTLSGDQKYNIGSILWDAYDVLFEIKLQQNLAIAFEEAGEDREKLDKDFYKRVEELTEREMDQVTAAEIEALNLDLTREKLQEIVASNN